MRSILLENSSQGVRENAGGKPVEEDAVAKTGKLQTTFSEAGKAAEEEAQKDLDEDIAKMISEGSPTCWCVKKF